MLYYIYMLYMYIIRIMCRLNTKYLVYHLVRVFKHTSSSTKIKSKVTARAANRTRIYTATTCGTNHYTTRAGVKWRESLLIPCFLFDQYRNLTPDGRTRTGTFVYENVICILVLYEYTLIHCI